MPLGIHLLYMQAEKYYLFKHLTAPLVPLPGQGVTHVVLGHPWQRQAALAAVLHMREGLSCLLL